jgi:nitronate monooxygenase
LLVDTVPAVVSFTFGCPPPHIVQALQQRGCLVMVTVTSATEAATAVDAGAQLVCAQGIEAGAHRSTFDDAAPDDELSTFDLVAAIQSRVDVPVVAAGGIATPDGVRGALTAGAVAVQVGTAFLRCAEAGTNAVHRAALVDGQRTVTTMTRAFTGRRARGLVNDFIRRHGDAPSAYPEIHHATRPLRVAAAATGDAERLHLWAGTGFRHAREQPAGDVVGWLAG